MVVWSYSLYGNNKEVYYRPMLENIRIAKAVGVKVMISTTDIFEQSVKDYFSAELNDIKINIFPSKYFIGSEMILRVLALETVQADFYFMKDSDSIVTDRELTLMSDWMLLSAEPYMIIRDNPIHVAPIMGGMFGLNISVRDKLVQSCQDYFSKSNNKASYGMDQQWLADHIYPIIRQKAKVYSSYFYFRAEKLVRINRVHHPDTFIGAQAEGNVNPHSMQGYFEKFYGDQLLSLPYFPRLPKLLSHLIYGRVRPSLYLAPLLKWVKR